MPPPRKQARSTPEQQHGRPRTLTYSELVEAVRNGELEGGEWSDKRNGFNINIGVDEEKGGMTYCTKNKHRLAELGNRSSGVFRAIDWYMHEKAGYLDPRKVVCNGRQCILLRTEFCVQRKGCRKGYDDLAALMHGVCVTEDCRIDLERFDVSVVVFDAVFESFPEKQDPPYHHRIECVAEAFSGFPRDPATGEIVPGSEYRDHTPQRLFSRSDLVATLTEHEGVVVCMGRAPFEHWVKIKPDRPVGLEIVAVLDTVGTQGFDKILIAAPDGENSRRVVDMIDLSAIFQDYDRVKQGKAYVNPASIRRDPVSGVIDCRSSSSLAPMLSALFGQISLHGGRLTPPSGVVSASEVRVGPTVVRCGTGRSFSRWFRRMLFLENPVRVTMSANEFWLVPGGAEEDEVHLQASRVLSVGRYGPAHFQNLPPVTHATLLEIAAQRIERNPRELFRLAGVAAGVVPFADLPVMDEGLFMAP